MASKVFALIPVAAFSWVLIFRSLLAYLETPATNNLTGQLNVQGVTVPDWENRVIWSFLFIATLLLAVWNRSRLSIRRLWSPPIISLVAYLIFSGASIAWAYSPELALSRFCLEIMVVVAIILPFAMPLQKSTMRGVYICYIFSIIINIIVVLNQSPVLNGDGTLFGYFGYFSFKGYLGECASVAIILASYELLFPGRRRYLAIFVILASCWLIVMSKSKGSLALTLIAPFLAGMAIIISSKLRTSLVVILTIIPACYFAVAMTAGNVVSRISYMLYGDYTLSSRTIIWDFIQNEMLRRPWLGWGFRSFWLTGPDAPSVTEAPYWVRGMSGGHSGYLDVRLETGYIGFALFMVFVVTAVYAIERVRRRDAVGAWLLLSLMLYVIVTNLIETVWLATNDPLWLLFVIAVAETTRYSPLTSQVSSAENRVGQSSGRAPRIAMQNRSKLPFAIRTNS